MLGKKCKRPIILDDEAYLDDWKGKWNEKFVTKDGKRICFSYPPSQIEFEIDGTYSFDGANPDERKVDIAIFRDYCRTLKKWQSDIGLLKTTDSAFIALFLLKTYPRIAEYLASRFPVIIVDEAQDTSEIQFAILNKLADAGLKSIELIGDPYQCLYQWRNARPDLLIEKTQDISQKWSTLYLNKNRRSTKTIIRCFSLLRQASEPEILSPIFTDDEKPIVILKYSPGNEVEAVQKFTKYCDIFEDNRVVVRGTPLRDKLLGRNISGLVFWKSHLPSQIILAKLEFDKNLIKGAVSRIRSLIPNILDPDIGYVQKAEQIEELKNNHEANAWIIQFLRTIPCLDATLFDWTSQAEKHLSLSLGHLLNREIQVDFQIKKDNQTKAEYTNIISGLMGTKSNECVDVSTIHQVKGKTFDSLLLILNENSKGQNISIKDVFTPVGFPTEKQRMIYVAMSRPRYLLAIGLPDTISQQVIQEKFGDKAVVE